jgi:glucokinase
MARTHKRTFWLGFDLGGTKMLAIVFDAQFRVVGSRRCRTKGGNVRKGLARIVNTIDEALQDAGIARPALAGIGMAAPGMLDLDRGILLHAPNLGWHRVPMKARLEKEFGVPVRLANDVDAGAYGEYRFGAARGARCALGVFPGTGIGGACVYEGRLLRGKVGSCMEIGHVPTVPNGPLCGCGQRGCLEAVASRLAIAAEAAQAAYRGEAPHLLAEAGTDIAAIRSGVIHAAIKAGDSAVERIVRQAATHIGRVIAGTVHLLSPDVIVLGGGLVEEMPGLFLGVIRETVDKSVTGAYRKTYRIVAATLGDRATALGAAALVAEAAMPTASRTARR